MVLFFEEYGKLCSLYVNHKYGHVPYTFLTSNIYLQIFSQLVFKGDRDINWGDLSGKSPVPGWPGVLSELLSENNIKHWNY